MPLTKHNIFHLSIDRREALVGGLLRVPLGLLLASAGLTRAVAGTPAAEVAAVHEVADGVFVHTGAHALQNVQNLGDISNAGFVIGDEAVAVIDTSGSYRAGLRLKAAVAMVTGKPIRTVINTHMHPDHVLGNAAFAAEGVELVAHAKMARALAARGGRYLEAAEDAMGAAAVAGTKIVLPERGIPQTAQIDLGGRRLRLEAMPTAHTDNDLVITDEKTGILFAGDIIFAGHVPALDGSLRGWLAVLDRIGKAPPKAVIPGHGPAIMDWVAGAEPVRRYFAAIARDVRDVIASGGTISQAMRTAARDEAGKWELFDEFHQRNVSAAFAELEWE